jgi:hypothetical protein
MKQYLSVAIDFTANAEKMPGPITETLCIPQVHRSAYCTQLPSLGN